MVLLLILGPPVFMRMINLLFCCRIVLRNISGIHLFCCLTLFCCRTAVDFLMENGKPGEIYNISAGNECTNIEITNIILDELKKPKSLIKNVEDRVGHDRRYSIDCSKLRLLGWKPGINHEDGIRSTIKWYVENQDWWSKIKTGEFLKYYKEQYDDRVANLSSFA